MVEITAVMVKQLRGKTGVGIMECKEALKECDGDLEDAFDFLRKKGSVAASKRKDRVASEGVVQSYIHMGGKIGVMVEVDCETDFVAKTDEFIDFTRNIAMHIAASNPVGIYSKDVSENVIRIEKDIYRAQALELGKPDKMIDRIIDGKLDKFFKENCLMNQQYVKDRDKSISEYLNEMVGRTGEKITIKRFVRFQIGETS